MEGNAHADRRSAPVRRRGRHRAGFGAALCVLFVAACSSTTTTTGRTTTIPVAGGRGVATSTGGGATSTARPPAATTTTTTTKSGSTTSTSTSSTSTSTSTTSTSSTSTTTTLPPTTTTLLLITQGGIVLVANASGIDGAAGSVSGTLAGLGFQTVKATNAAGYEDMLDVSKVYFAPEAYGPAYSIAQLMGGVAVAPMPTPPPIVAALEGLRGANVIVMLGKDLAGKPLPGVR